MNQPPTHLSNRQQLLDRLPLLKGLVVEGFKSIRDRIDIEMRRLTILDGANSSGKSSLLQPLLLLKQTFEARYDPGPLLLNGPHLEFAQVNQMLWKPSPPERPADMFRVGLEIGQYGRTVYVETAFNRRLIRVQPIQVNDCIWIENGVHYLLRPGMRADELKEILRQIKEMLRKNRGDKQQPVAEIEETFGQSELEQILSTLEVARDRSLLYMQACMGDRQVLLLPLHWNDVVQAIRRIIHVPALRGYPRRANLIISVQNEFPGLFQDYVASLIAAWQQGDKACLEQLGNDLRELEMTSQVTARQINDTQVEILVGRVPLKEPSGDLVNIADAGFGVSQVLPVVVALLAATPGQIVYLEQPELLLSPRARVALAGMVQRAIKRGVQVIVETHSDVLLLAIQRLIADGTLSPHEVTLHWCSRDSAGVTCVSSRDFDSQGGFNDWPEDFAAVRREAMRDYLSAAIGGSPIPSLPK